MTAGISASPITAVAIGIARSARELRLAHGLPSARPTCCRCGYFHIVFTLPAEIADIAWQNKAVVYDLLFKAASETMMTIAADPKHLAARIGITAVLHTWGSAMTHHPHVHMIVPGGGVSPDGMRWIAARARFLLPVRVLSKLFRRLFLTRFLDLHAVGKLAFFGQSKDLGDRRAFLRHVAPLKRKRWQVYAKAPFAGPEAVLAYLSRYTHRVAISNRRLIAFDKGGVTFHYKDYRRSRSGPSAGHDAPDPRVHAPLPAACSATRFSPYPALWAARQRHSQGQHRLRPRAPGRSASTGTHGLHGTTRSAPALSLLRRTHAHHRDLCVLEPATCAAASVHVSRYGTVVTRHGLILYHVAARLLRPQTRRAPIALNKTISDEVLTKNALAQPLAANIPRAQIDPRRFKSAARSHAGTRVILKSP